MPKTETRKTVGIVVAEEPRFGPGVVVSLDLRRGAYLRVSGGFILSRWHPTARIPGDLDGEDMRILEAAYKRGLIVLGDNPPRPVERVDGLKPLMAQLDQAQSLRDAQPIIMKLMREPKTLKHMSQYDLVQNVIKHEIMGSCRDDLLNYLVEVLNNIPGPTPVKDLPQDQRRVTLTVGAATDPKAALPDYI